MPKGKKTYKANKYASKAEFTKAQMSKIKKIVKKEEIKGTPAYICNVRSSAFAYTSIAGTPSTYLLFNTGGSATTPQDSAVQMLAQSSGFAQASPCYRPASNILIRRIHIRCNSYVPSLVSQPNARFRVILFVDKMPEASQPNVLRVLDQDDSISSVYNDVNIDFKKRFRIISDKMHHIQQVSVPTYNNGAINLLSGNSAQAANTFWEIKKTINMRCNVNRAGAGLFSDYDSGQLCIGIVNDYINASTIQHTFNCNIEYEGLPEPKEKI